MPRKKPLKAPFVVTVSVAAAATFAVACGGKSLDISNPPPVEPIPTSTPDSGNPPVPPTNPPPPEPVCPMSEPHAGDYCSVWGTECRFQDRCMDRPNGSAPNRRYTCANGEWQRQDPYRASCPGAIPQSGESCAACADDYPAECKYLENTGCPPVLAVCDPKTLTWQVAISSCNPPPPDAGGGDDGP